ncbi:MAG: SEC-C metal-binding domain-containing protein [Polyangia bacterium]
MTADKAREDSSASPGEEEQQSRARLSATGRNDPCPCGSGRKYKKCHLVADEAALIGSPVAPQPEALLANGWRLLEQRRPGAAEKEFRAALALRPDWSDALVAIGLARLQTGDNDGARQYFHDVQRVSEKVAAELRASGAKDGFARKEAQPYLRACHALGCLAYDGKSYDETLVELARVYEVDQSAVGTEARLIAGAALIKLGRAAEAVPVLEPASKEETGASRAPMSLALAHFLAGDRASATASLAAALAANPSLGRALLAKVPKRPTSLAGAAPGSKEEALGYVQTYGDAWEAPAKKFLEEFLVERGLPEPASVASPPSASQ